MPVRLCCIEDLATYVQRSGTVFDPICLPNYISIIATEQEAEILEAVHFLHLGATNVKLTGADGHLLRDTTI